jgi:hypothetical protein
MNMQLEVTIMDQVNDNICEITYVCQPLSKQ